MSTNLSNASVNRLPFTARFPVDVWLTGVAFLIPASYLFLHNQTRILVAFMFLGALILIWMRDRTMGIVATFAFLLTLGDIRRILDTVAPASAGLDLMLLVGPLFAVYLAIPLLLRLKVSDTLSKALLALMAIMIVEMFNPRQGSIVVGFSGALFYIIPIFWFWIARNYATDRMMFLLFYRVFLPIGILDGLLGVAQAYIGFFPWEKAWALKLGSQYIYTAGHLRSFGFSTGASEFASTLLIASVCVMAAIFAGRRTYVLLLPILIAASILASSRGLIVKLLFASAMIWAVRSKGGRNWLPRLIFALVLGFGLTMYSASQAGGDDTGTTTKKSTTAEIATQHVTKGLANPLEAKSSTAGVHWQIFVGGIVKGFTYPIGTGIGAVTLGAGKFTTGGATTGSSEVDISDAFITMGFVGGFLYLFIIYKVFRLAFLYVRKGSLIMSLAYVGCLAALFGGWLALGQYSTAPFVWFCIGSLVRKSSSLDAPGLAQPLSSQRL
ncbi:MAG: hypothetical protein JWM43_897 [Acidobacteriaceae bacterium]|nr:hypothetical protein [Acidobacteriaceae bacterium]